MGMFLGLEREWSQKSAGIRTFALISLLGGIFIVTNQRGLLVVGGLLVLSQSVLIAIRGLLEEDEGLSLTTSVSMLIAYGVGVLVAEGYILSAITVTVGSSLLLVLKRELHSFAWGLTHEELRSAAEFAIVAFVVYPLLPAGIYHLSGYGLTINIEPRVIWLMVVTVAGIGIINYIIVQGYGGRGIVVTGFFGGLASSTAVVGTMLDHVRQHPATSSYAVAAILLADAAMALRNLVITIAFTAQTGLLIGAVVPLGAVILGSLVVAYYIADWSQEVEVDLESPFSLRNALFFGFLFFLIVVAGGVAKGMFGAIGFYVTAAFTGLVSSAGAITSAVLLYRGGGLSANAAIISILLATGSSIIIKAGLTAYSPNRAFSLRVAAYSVLLLALSGIATIIATM
jgi:uncharacterized membrane protein (DUF4010 family)